MNSKIKIITIVLLIILVAVGASFKRICGGVMKDKAKAGILLGIAIGLLISLYILPSERVLNISGRIIMAVGCLMWSVPYIKSTRENGDD